MTALYETPLIDMLMCLSSAIDMVNPLLSNHNKQVAAISSCIGEEMGLSKTEIVDIVMAGALHDIGALSLDERLNLLNFEVENTDRHALLGYRHLRSFAPFEQLASIVRYHHRVWGDRESHKDHEGIPLASYIIHCADRIAVLISRKKFILEQVDDITNIMRQQSGKLFMPEVVDAFLRIAKKEAFWFTITSDTIEEFLSKKLNSVNIKMNEEMFLEFSRMFGRVIDFRSPYTAQHSSRVSMTAESLARFSGMSEPDVMLMKRAGFMHDIGKLAVPTEILDKAGPLTRNERMVMISHPFYTDYLLSRIKNFDTIRRWAACHHEELSGNGYPFHYTGDELGTGERIMAVADKFTALSEDRPYRKGLPLNETKRILEEMAHDNQIDGDIVSLTLQHAAELREVQKEADKEISLEFEEFIK